MTAGSESISYGYDGSLLTSETLSGTLNQTLSYGYNNDFNVTSFTYAGTVQTNTYDNDGLLTGAGSFTISRNVGNGLPEAVTGGSFSLGRTFNGYGEVESQDVTVGASNIVSWDVDRDNNGRITNKTEFVNGVTSTYDYTYDSMGRLATVTKNGALVEEYQYNQNGIRTYEINTLRGISGRSLTYSNEDHLLTAGGTTYNYNLDGYLTSKTNSGNTTTYDYSSRGELQSVDLPDGRVISYLNDPMGRRIGKQVNGTITEKYLWQGLTRLLAVYNGSNALIMRFEYADARMPVAMTKGGATYYLAYDQTGSLKAVTNSSGAAVKVIDYDSFGNIIIDTNPSFTMPFGFAGGLYDADTGLVRFGYRDYDPDTGRWTAKDPILFAGGDSDLYGYCLNDPVNLVDSDGEIPTILAGAISGAVIGGVIGGISSAINGGNVWHGVATGLISGGLTGAGIGSGFFAGAIIGALTDYATQVWDKWNNPCAPASIDMTSIAIAGVSGAAGGWLGNWLQTRGGADLATSAMMSGALSGGAQLGLYATAYPPKKALQAQ
jgi:RHS repeat-associated protein